MKVVEGVKYLVTIYHRFGVLKEKLREVKKCDIVDVMSFTNDAIVSYTRENKFVTVEVKVLAPGERADLGCGCSKTKRTMDPISAERKLTNEEMMQETISEISSDDL